ncbi:gonadotropin subunit beta-2-like [Asterias rubens]|nr:gonadotropin subunit beta-2-like [Asterias rubens]
MVPMFLQYQRQLLQRRGSAWDSKGSKPGKIHMDQGAAYTSIVMVTLVMMWACALAINPVTTTNCYVHTAMKHLVEKPGCRPHELVVFGCWGRCDTNEVPSLDPPFVEAYHPVCTLTNYEDVKVKLPDCDPEVDPTYTYQSALSCGCANIDDSSTKYSYRPDYFVSEK